MAREDLTARRSRDALGHYEDTHKPRGLPVLRRRRRRPRVVREIRREEVLPAPHAVQAPERGPRAVRVTLRQQVLRRLRNLQADGREHHGDGARAEREVAPLAELGRGRAGAKEAAAEDVHLRSDAGAGVARGARVRAALIWG